MRLRQLRDRVAACSPIGARLIERIYADYYRFSPAIAAELDRAAGPRDATLRLVVQPLLAWYTLAGALAFTPNDQVAVDTAAKALRAACPRYGRTLTTGILNALLDGRAMPARLPGALRAYTPQIETAARLPFARWAMLDALALAWRPASHRDPASAVATWLAAAPLDRLAATGMRLDVQLGALAHFFDFAPAARLLLGQRLLLAYPNAAAALVQHGFVVQGDRSWQANH